MNYGLFQLQFCVSLANLPATSTLLALHASMICVILAAMLHSAAN